MTILAEISLVVDTGYKSVEDAYKALNELNGVSGHLLFKTTDDELIDYKVKDYFIKYSSEEAV